MNESKYSFIYYWVWDNDHEFATITPSELADAWVTIKCEMYCMIAGFQLLKNDRSSSCTTLIWVLGLVVSERCWEGTLQRIIDLGDISLVDTITDI